MRARTISAVALVALFGCFGVGSAEAAEQKNGEAQSIVRAAKPAAVDGSLGEWNKSGRVGPLTFDPESIDEFNATVYAMYDPQYLYLAAEVVIPHPPYNPYPLRGQGDWNADDVIVRLSSNPALGYPVVFKYPDQSGKSDKARDLFTVDIWWNHLEKKTRFAAYYGLAGAEKMQDSKGMPGAQAVVKTRANGKGYTCEARIPWKIINPSFKPKPGDIIALTWEIAVSNGSPSDPRRFFQIFGNGGGAWAFTDTSLWGKAVFL